MTSGKESFVSEASKLLDQLSKSQAESLILFQSKEFVGQCPCSGTSVLLRCLFDQEVRGVIVAFYVQQRQVDIGIISSQLYEAYKDFAGAAQGPDSLEVRVLRVQKAQGPGAPPGLREIFQRFQDNGITTVSHFKAEEQFLQQTKVMQEVGAFFKEHSITYKELDKNFMVQIISRPAPGAWEREFAESAKQALRAYQQVAAQLERQKYVSSTVKAQLLAKSIGAEGLTEVSKSANAEFYSQEREKLRGYRSFQALLNCSDMSLALKALQAQRVGQSAVVRTSGSLPIDAINLNIEVQDHIAARIGRTIVSVSDADAKSAVIDALEHVTKVHQEALAEVQVGKTSAAVKQTLDDLYTRECKQGTTKNREWSVKFLKDGLSTVTFAGIASSGVCVSSQAAEIELPGLFSASTPEIVLLPGHLIQFRTAAEVRVGSYLFIIAVEDAMQPLDDNNIRPITSPYHTRNSPFAVQRDYFYVVDKSNSRVQSDSPVRQSVIKQEERVNDKNNVDSSSDDDNRQNTGKDRRQKQRELQRKRPELEEAVYQRQISRQQQQRLLCDSKQNISAPTCFDSVMEMPKNLDFTDKSVVLGDPLFFIINGRPVPILPQYIHQALTVEQDNGVHQIKVKFVAPGNVQGKKEQHPQLDQYQLATFLKELVLETTSASFAAKIQKELKNYKKIGDEVVAKQTTSGYFAPPPDPDHVFPEGIVRLIERQPNAAKAVLRPLHSIDNRAMNAPIMSRPRLRSTKQSNKRDQGELHICQQGVHYKYIASGSNPVSIFLNYQNIKNVYFEKFTNKQHVLVLSFRLYKARKLSEMIVGSSERIEGSDRTYHSLISFYVSMESETRLGAGADRDDVRAEQAKKEDMRRGNDAFQRLLHAFQQASANWFTTLLAGAAERLGLGPGELKAASELHKKYFGKVVQHNRDLRFQASAEGQGLQLIYSYSNGAIGCFNKRISLAIELDDIELVVFENVSYASRGAFQMAFVYKDVRVETQILKQIRFDDLQEIELYLLSQNIYYTEISDSLQWNQLRTSLNKDRDAYESFAQRGGWLNVLGIRGEDSSEQESSAPTASSEASYQVSDYDDETGYSSEDESSDVKSVSGHDSEEDDYVYDWDRSDD